MVRILAVETSEQPGSVAVAEDQQVLAEVHLDRSRRTTEALIPAAKQLLEQLGWQPQSLDLVACCLGPGSFTGLRIGITVAKVLAYCCNAQVVAPDTLDVIAEQVPSEFRHFWVAVDAQRGQAVVVGYRRNEENLPEKATEPELVEFADWVCNLPAGSAIVGSALKRLKSEATAHLRVLSPSLWSARAAALAQVALRHYRAGKTVSVWELKPWYIRPSYAEEKFPSGGPYYRAQKQTQ